MKRLPIVMASFTVLALVLAACAPATPRPTEVVPTEGPVEPTPEEAGELEFIMVQHALCAWDSFWCTVEQGITDAAA
ncbi:MAG TPA: hypothetical protein VGA32_06035, partial [Anaerolineales bacterium]